MSHSLGSVWEWNFAGRGFQDAFRIVLLLICASTFVMLTITVTRVIQANHQPHFVVITAYADVMPGQSIDVTILEAKGFSCKEDMRPTPADLAELCSNSVANQQVGTITILVWDAIVKRLDLKLQDGIFVIGDLALLWGQPEVQHIGHWVDLCWHERHVSASVWSDNEQFSYFRPISQLSFGL